MRLTVYLSVIIVALFTTGCDRTVPSSYEIHYNNTLTDSVVFVNYNLNADSSCNFYMLHSQFTRIFTGNNYPEVYAYHRAHPIAANGIDYTTYRRKEFYHNNNPEDAEYYQSHSGTVDQKGSEPLKPSSPGITPTRPYNYRH